ncbi:hypothetical protein D3C84_877390 [compost metagenome]
MHFDRQLTNTLEILLVLNGLFLTQLDDFIEQRRHFCEVGRVGQVFLDDLAANVVLNRFGYRSLIAFHLTQFLGNGLANARLHDQVQQSHIVKGGNFARFAGLNVGVDQMPHVRLKRLDVERLSAGHADDFAQHQVSVPLALDLLNLRSAVTCPFHLISQIRIRA